ncbi:MAG: hypothetical protein ABI416_05110 [Ginsengibacter sp.]
MSGTKWLQKQEHFEWMQKCLTCWKMSEEFIAWSIQNGQYLQLINACRDTAEMCSQCIKFEAQRSPFFQQLCEVCAGICEKCAQGLEKYKDQNSILSDTVDACKIFAMACREIAEEQTEGQPGSPQDYAKKN